MKLNLKKLEALVRLNDGGYKARCPACKKLGHDNTGNHLRIFPNGKFGCCVYPKNREHRRVILQCAGNEMATFAIYPFKNKE